MSGQAGSKMKEKPAALGRAVGTEQDEIQVSGTSGGEAHRRRRSARRLWRAPGSTARRRCAG